MATTISNGESGSSVRTKLNDIWEGLQINEIASTIADTAVDIFVYDTRKDSDGGAWRKRTQHTSWYNETLNTATRGSRKEFPAVAVIVAESNQVTIYDGDDPDLPMWMVFDGASGTTTINMLFNYNNPRPFTCCSMLNSQLVVGTNTNSGALSVIDFIRDNGKDYNGVAGLQYYNGNIEQRNDGLAFGPLDNTYQTVSRENNDVAMTVLPNAPIDAATGLPVPTIAVATDGGVSVIKDDGTVVDVSSAATNNNTKEISFDAENNIWFVSQNSGGLTQYYAYYKGAIPSSDISYTPLTSYRVDDAGIPALGTKPVSDASSTLNKAISYANNKVVASPYSLAFLSEDATTPANGMVAYTTSSYNTGWMNGDIKLATLSDTDDTNVTGSELVTNGTFDTDTSGWTDASSNWSVTSGQVSSSGSGYLTQAITTVAGEVYTISIDAVTIVSPYLRVVINGAVVVQLDTGDTGTKAGTFTATSSSTTIEIRPYSSGQTIDNVSVRLAEEDRSVNGNGLQVFGTVTKSAVSSGADLVAYSGFSTGNYLSQPYNSDLDFGTGDFCIMAWVKLSSLSGGQIIASWGNSDTGGNYARWAAYVENATGDMAFFQSDGSFVSSTNDGPDVSVNTWNHLVWIRSAAGVHFYLNGDNHIFESADPRNINNSDNMVIIGADYGYLTPAGNTSAALLRISATAPTPEQISKTYNDEKVLFQEGAKAVLAGTSDAVTSLAYDDDQQELLVGTSQYTSVFRGLRRVEEISGSASAISASNGLRVIED